MSVEKKLKTALPEAAQDIGDGYFPEDVSVMNLAEVLKEVDNLKSKISRLTFCKVLSRVEEILGLFAGTAVPEEQKKMIKLIEEGTPEVKVALQESFCNILEEICSANSYQEELATLSKKDTMKNVITASHIKHLLGLMGLRMKIFRGNKKLSDECDVPMQPLLNKVKLNDIKNIVKRELSRYPIDELVDVITDDSDRERFKAAVHDELNEIACGSGRIETAHLTVNEEYATPWLELWKKIRASENVFPQVEYCPVCMDNCDEQSVLVMTDGCDDTLCLKCAVQCFGTGKERGCPQCMNKLNYWTSSQDFNKLRTLGKD